MTPSRPDPEAAVTLSQAVQHFDLDQPTAARIRALLNGMGLRWVDQQGVRYRLGDVIAALAYIRAVGTQAEQRPRIDPSEPCPFCGADTTRGWYADYCVVCGAEYDKVMGSQGG